MNHSKLLLVAFFATVNIKPVKGQLKPGDIAPNAKVLDTDIMNEFNNGAAIVQKGNSEALIDITGNFIVPFNKYKFNFFERGAKGIYNGIFSLELSREALNAKGELIAKGLTLISRTPKDGRYRFITTRDGLLAINSDDQRFLVKGTNGIIGLGGFSEGLVVYWTGGASKMKFGFKNLKDQIVIQPAYDKVGLFSDGMAVVGCKNEFGEMKYGFINKEGQLVIPCMYTNIPSDFYCGRSLVYPKANTGFEYAYINKKGELAIKYTQEMYQKYGQLHDGFFNGYSFNDRFVMDTSGNVYSYEAFFTKFGVKNPGDKKLKLLYQIPRETWTEGQVLTYTRLDYNNRAGSTTGFIDVTTHKAIEGPFLQTQQFFFDPVSKLAYAEANLGKNSSGQQNIRKGYINTQGVFVIVRGEDSKW
ncbi:MAG: WG repeat-containing protein [Chitinophagaceae bacterium]